KEQSSTESYQYFKQHIRKLKGAGHSSLKKDDYFRMLKDARKIFEGSQRTAGTKEGATHALYERFKVDDGEDGRCGIWDRKAGKGDGDFITNFTVVFDQDIEVLDDIASQRKFKGTLKIRGREVPFEIPHKDFSSDNGLREMIFKVAGAEAQIKCELHTLRQAISAVSTGKIVSRKATSNFGWSVDGSQFLVPGGFITGEGF